MSIFKNLGDTLSANINEAVENTSRPDVMARYYADKAEDELMKARNRAAAISADRKALERDIEELERELKEANLDRYAAAAAAAGNAEDAKRFLAAKEKIEASLRNKRSALESAKASEKSVLAAYDAQAKEVESMQSDMIEISANVAAAASKGANTGGIGNAPDRSNRMFRKMLGRSRRMAAIADAAAEIEAASSPAALDDLKMKYDVQEQTSALLVDKCG